MHNALGGGVLLITWARLIELIRRLVLLASFSKVFSVFYLWRSSRKISIERVSIASDDLPAAMSGLRIALLTDFHGRSLNPASTTFAAIANFAPDIVCLGGDYVSSHPAQAHALGPMLHELSSLAPTFAVSGNHDHRVGWTEIAAFLESCGVRVLSNRSVIIEHRGGTVWLTGVDDPASGHDKLVEALPAEMSHPIICLVHSPSWFLHGHNPLPEAASLVLAGHTHGGQIKLPLIGAVTNATGMLFPRRLVEGLSREGHSWLYINRGLGYTRIPLRFMSPAEVTLITLGDAAQQ